MKVADAVAHALKAEGVEILFAYPVNSLIESAAKLDIRTIIVRQERIGLHMADAVARMTSGERIGVFCMQSGPGAELVSSSGATRSRFRWQPAGLARRADWRNQSCRRRRLLGTATRGDSISSPRGHRETAMNAWSCSFAQST